MVHSILRISNRGEASIVEILVAWGVLPQRGLHLIRVSRFLGLSEAETLRSWTVITALIGLVGVLVASVLAML